MVEGERAIRSVSERAWTAGRYFAEETEMQSLIAKGQLKSCLNERKPKGRNTLCGDCEIHDSNLLRIQVMYASSKHGHELNLVGHTPRGDRKPGQGTREESCALLLDILHRVCGQTTRLLDVCIPKTFTWSRRHRTLISSMVEQSSTIILEVQLQPASFSTGEHDL